EFGTYDAVPAADADVAPGEALVLHLRRAGQPPLLEGCFLLAEGVRLHHRMGAVYPALQRDSLWAAGCLLARPAAQPRPARARLLDALLAVALGARSAPDWLAPEVASLVGRVVVPLASPGATAQDALRVAGILATVLVAPAEMSADEAALEAGLVPLP